MAKKKILKSIPTIILAIILLIVLVALGSVAVEMIRGNQPSVFGYRLYYILTDSMTPELEVGDIILSKTINNKEDVLNLKVGDTVTFIGTSGAQRGNTITHKVYEEAKKAEDGKTYILTKGVKKGAPVDAPVPIENVRAVKVSNMPVTTKIFSFVGTPLGLTIIVMIPVISIISYFAIKFLKSHAKHDTDNSDSQK